MRALALQYGWAPACILLAVLVQLSPAGPALHPTGLFAIAVVAAAWFGGAGAGFLAAGLAAFTLPRLIAMSYPLLGGVLDLPRFIIFSVAGLAVGWWSFRRRQVEAALRESEKRYELAINASDEGFWDWIPAGDKLYLSPRFLEIFGFAPGTTFAGRAAMFEALTMPPEDRAALHQTINEHFAGKTAHMEKEFRILVDGEMRWIQSRGLATRNAEGEVVRWNGAARDVTARKRAEEALRVSEERHARAMEASAAGHWDWNMLTDELFVSERALEMFALPPGQLPPTRTEFLSLMSKYRADMDEGVQASLRSGVFDRVYRVVLQTGSVRWLNSRGKVYKDASGTPVRMTGSVTDITERKLALDELRNSEQRYALAMEAAGDGHTDWDLVSGEFYISPRLLEIVGHPPDARFADRADWVRRFPFHPEDRPKWEAAVAEHHAGRESHFKMELRIVVRGRVRWTAFHFLSTRDTVGKPIRWTGSIADITDQKRAEHALRESEDRFARAVAGSHDGVWDIDFVARTVFISARTRELCGLPSGPEMVPLAGWFEALPLHPEDRPRRTAAFEAHLLGKTPVYEGEFRLKQRDGVYAWCHIHGVCVRDANGKPLRMAGSIKHVDDRRRAEDALRESEARYERVVAATEAGFWDWDMARDSYYVSPKLIEMAGLPAGTIIARREDFQALVPLHPEDMEKWKRAIRELVESGDSRLSMVVRMMLPAGMRWYRADGICFRDAAGKAVRWTGSAIDVSEAKLAEEALRESQERYEYAMDSSDVGYFDWIPAVDKIYTSPRLLEIYGFAPGTTFAGRNDLLARIPFHPEDRPPLMRAYADHIAGKTARYSVELRFIRDGETRWASLTGLATRDASDAMVRWSGTVRDVTERKRSELALRQSEERYELAMAASESGYWDWDILTGRYFVSPRAYELAGFPTGTTWASRDDYRAHINMHPEDFARWEAAREALFAGTGERLAMEVRYMVNGDPRWHMLNAICKRDETGKVVRWTGSATDITERKRAEEGLKELERKLRLSQRLEAVGTLAGGIAHDFNNILGAILGYSEIAQYEAPKGSRLARDLRKITIAGERGRALVDRVLAFSRSAIGERVAVHVERVVREALDLITANLPPNVTLRPKLHAGAAAVLGDATQVHQVVANLAANAVQAMPAGGTLRLELAVERVEAPRATTIGELRAGDYVVLTVADSGSGIAPEILDRIFDPFFTTKEVGTGTGLGLSLVHGIVTELDGAIDVASTLGTGSTFAVYLPRSGDAAETVDEKAWALPRGDGQRVLVVDDEEPLVELATRTLANLGYLPTGFTSSAAALEAFREDPEGFDALITDERMPGMSGSTLIREVRGMRSSLPVVLMSGYLGATESKADEVLQKPLSARDLAASLARVLRL